ncbi:Mpo1-like protein [Roseovarius sp. EL26]|uniref:Mpo1-like protein n=1 Tax=Roseovarius sp. EL26 TaxID=2126672 RepID=UPI0013C447BD|nr:Mpo1-like protein [Roseovarius sp. EL26]
MNKLGPLLDEYELSHKHPFNLAVHWVAEPLAIFALMALAGSLRLPIGSLLWPFLAIMLIYYGWLSIRIALAFLPVVAVFVLLISFIDNTLGIQAWKWAVPLFVACWFALLFGHKIEGRVPSVFQNPNLIFVGPVWLMRIIFRRFHFPDP